LAINSSTISHNSSEDDGGGIKFSGYRNRLGDEPGPFSLNFSTVSGNTAVEHGGAIAIYGTSAVTIGYSTIYDNSSGIGGAIKGGASTIVNHSIVAGNKAILGPVDIGGSYGGDGWALVPVLHYSLIGNNDGTNLIEAPVGSPDANGNFIGGSIHGIIDPHLAPLADNGGPTPTHALLATSPALDAGNPSLIPGVGGIPEFDQRGTPFSRVISTAMDMGSYESSQTPMESIGLLRKSLLALDLQNRVEKSLLKNLDRAMKKLGDANPRNDWSAIAQLKAFSIKVRLLSGRRLDRTDADMLLNAADHIVAEIRNDILRPWFDEGLFDLLARSKFERSGFFASKGMRSFFS
jgi:hypothetical protein